MSKLNPEDLVVTSFDTTEPSAAAYSPDIIITPNDPTAATWCYICPVYSEGGCW